jgi:hypothetical protein
VNLLFWLLLPLAAKGIPATPHTAVMRAAGLVSACRAVTQTDIQRTLGRRVAAGEEETSGPESSCDYVSGTARVTVTVQRLDKTLDLHREIGALAAAVPEGRLREAPDLGAPAFFLDIADAGTQLHLVRGKDYVMVSILGFGEGERVSAAAVSLMRAALERVR